MKTEQLFIETHRRCCTASRRTRCGCSFMDNSVARKKPCRLPKSWLRTHRFCPSTCRITAHAKNRDEEFAPWTAAPELTRVMAYARAHWRATNVRATSIGAYFARLAFAAPEKALFVSPIVDMERLICDRICAAGITEQILRERGMYPAREGDMLSWDYLCWVRAHPAKGLVTAAVHSLRRK